MSGLAYLIIGGSILTIGDIIFKFYTEKPQNILYILGISIYLVGLIFLIQSFKTQNIAIASTIFIIVNVVTLAFVSWLYFGDKLSILQIIGIGLAFIAVLLME